MTEPGDAADAGITPWMGDVIERVGEVGVALLIFLENVFPPIPSEAVLGLAGIGVAEGRLNGPLVWLAATSGSLAGAYVLYLVGALVGVERLEHLASRRWFPLFGLKDLRRGERVFERHGGAIVLFGRLVPLVRSAVSVPAGVARMPLLRFTVLTVLGSAVWNAALIYAGFTLGSRFHLVEEFLGPISYLVAAAVVALLAWLVVRRYRARRRGEVGAGERDVAAGG